MRKEEGREKEGVRGDGNKMLTLERKSYHHQFVGLGLAHKENSTQNWLPQCDGGNHQRR